MGKLLHFIDNYLLKIGISFLILFIPLYPKLPSINIHNTWVYIRLEDFFIAAVVGIWFIHLVRRKVRIPWPVGLPFFLYWFFGLLSLLFAIFVLAPTLVHFFPHVAILSYLRRIEYMILFFVAFSTIRSIKDLRDYIVILSVALTGILLYGFGQRFYLTLWQAFPAFFEQFSFCFPSFQTGNEEFAKGIPLCLPDNARITSTFAGHYDLAAYLVMVIPLITGVMFGVKQWKLRIVLFLLAFASILLLIFTASRVSFGAYIVGMTALFFLLKQKKYIIPFFIFSVVLLMLFNESTAKRFLDTVRLTSIVTTNEGQVVGEAVTELPEGLKKKVDNSKLVLDAPPPTQDLPTGSSFVALPSKERKQATTSALVKNQLSEEEAKRLQLEHGGLELSTVSGSFLIQKALVYDISFTTRFQAEWPHAWQAFLRNPPLGSGFSSITLATDNDYIRALGETGFFGLLSFLFIFLILGITAKRAAVVVTSPVGRNYILGISAGVIGLLFNAVLIDVFEASKVAENLWLLVGIGAGVAALYQKQPVNYLSEIRRILTSTIFMAIYLTVLGLIVFAPFVNNFFVADDFTWLRWAASSSLSDIPNYFTDATGFFYRPLDKLVMFFLYTFFSFQPAGYHFFILLLHVLVSFGVFLFAHELLKNRLLAFLAAVLFLLLPIHAENVFWLSTISSLLSSVFVIYGFYFMFKYRRHGLKIGYFLAFLFFVLGLLSYEMAIIFPLLILVLDLSITKPKWDKMTIISYIPFIAMVPLYLILRKTTNTVGLYGDYSYNMVKLLPNVIGNYIGYIALFLFGESIFPLYTELRDSLRMNFKIVTGVILVVIGIIGTIVWSFRQKISQLVSSSKIFPMIFFGIAFSIAALLPFLGLGNITQRYGYLASIGYVLVFIVVLQGILAVLLKNKKRLMKPILVMIVFLISLWYYTQLQYQGNIWAQAGVITRNTLGEFRIAYEDIPEGATLYFANVPIRKGEAWIFPVGLADGLWFIYRDDALQVEQVKDREALEVIKQSLSPKEQQMSYFFIFDQNGNIHQVK